MRKRNEGNWIRPLALIAALGAASASWLTMIPAALAQEKSVTVGYFPSWIGGWPAAISKKKGFYAKHMPPGTTVNYDLQLIGAPIVNNMLAGKTDVGYVGDFPAIVAATKRDIQDIRVVATNSWSAGQLCNLVLARSDAPQFSSPADALKWLSGKTVAVPKGSCMDRFLLFLQEKEGLKVEVVYQSPEVIATNLRAKKIDAGILFQAFVAQITTRGIGRVALTGAPWKLSDGAFIIMRKGFIDANRAAAKGFLKAEIEAFRFMDEQPEETVRIVAEELPGFSKRELWNALYGRMPAASGATEVNLIAPMVIDDEARKLLDGGVKFLHDRKVVNVDRLPEGTYYGELINEAMREMKATAPLVTFKARGANPFKD